MVWPMSLRIAGGLLAFPGEDGSDRFPVLGLWIANSHRNDGWGGY